ncbi:hypothetical protein VT91_28320 [Clostridium sporogenes]|jgi:hypothetical protein|uniref:Uncharacterized protein n=4 Tax=Bacillota TaxID=1239 RepID=A0A2T0B9U1_9CLOT|nr:MULTISPECIES: hypothetical protein [Bacillota]KRU26839.1 hypothetical protein WG71_24620 [Clostridium sporogenes]KRU26881.1 hypothetical protein VT91_28320 [Clostridium sporogenes]KRU34980.1 hypothetical protein VT28_02150 [Clostridium sporogenes]KRU43340.1 hypothetical protein VT95_17120 [Clostridium sporogenes]MBU5426145.1 hypothetical protein [Tissierella pigra]
MREIEFRQWLSKNNISKKMQSDLVSRLKRFEKAIENCDIDEQYRSDKFYYLFSLFQNKGLNDNMNKFKNVDLPIGKYQLSIFKYALNKYKQFIEDEITSKPE